MLKQKVMSSQFVLSPLLLNAASICPEDGLWQMKKDWKHRKLPPLLSRHFLISSSECVQCMFTGHICWWVFTHGFALRRDSFGLWLRVFHASLSFYILSSSKTIVRWIYLVWYWLSTTCSNVGSPNHQIFNIYRLACPLHTSSKQS